MIVLQRRERFDIRFDRTFEEYEAGFGDYSGEGDLWLGLKRVHTLTQHGRWNLRLSMRSFYDNNILLWGEWTGNQVVENNGSKEKPTQLTRVDKKWFAINFNQIT